MLINCNLNLSALRDRIKNILLSVRLYDGDSMLISRQKRSSDPLFTDLHEIFNALVTVVGSFLLMLKYLPLNCMHCIAEWTKINCKYFINNFYVVSMQLQDTHINFNLIDSINNFFMIFSANINYFFMQSTLVETRMCRERNYSTKQHEKLLFDRD